MSRIPIAAAKRISKDYGIDQVVILGRVPESEPGNGDGMEYVTTYGRTTIHCQIAALMGNKLKRILGWPADRCMDKPPRQRRREKGQALRIARAMFACTSPQLSWDEVSEAWQSTYLRIAEVAIETMEKE